MNFVTIRQQFRFKSIEIGQWVTPKERDRAAYNFYQALTDLMAVLNVPESAISLRESLGLQYGKGGRPGVSAHYVPMLRKLSLAKNAGAGSLAHEWFHAFDHYMGEKMFPIADRMQFASKLWLNDYPYGSHPLNELLAQCFETILLSHDTKQPSDMFIASQQTDERLGVLYYSRPEEMCARAFEAFVEDTAPNSRFLVRGSRYSQEAELGLYPKGNQRLVINEMFQQYFSMLGAALYREQEKLAAL
ncbi:CLCA_X family protein [Marinomonas ostreistagni]|uniref:CLCA_X family protein n=1 Tax=Marinomonas ostreistagni TaxID=359209 RepID=UPI0030841A0E